MHHPVESPSRESSPTTTETVSCEHTLADWEAHREHFVRLYVLDDRTLPDVKAEMASRHGFHATERQYKRKIADWKLEKNVKDSDMRVLLRKQLKRKLESGKDSHFSIHGRPVPPEKITRFLKRKSLTQEAILEEQTQTPSYITCTTPPVPEDVDQKTGLVPADGASNDEEPSEDHGFQRAPETPRAASAEASIPGTLVGLIPPRSTLGAESRDIEVLADFAATMACFLWNAPVGLIDRAETWTPSMGMDVHGAVPVPSKTLAENVSRFISVVQIPTNVLREAMYFIYWFKYTTRYEGVSARFRACSASWSTFDIILVALCVINKSLEEEIQTTSTRTLLRNMTGRKFPNMSGRPREFKFTEKGLEELNLKIDAISVYLKNCPPSQEEEFLWSPRGSLAGSDLDLPSTSHPSVLSTGD